MKNIVKLCALCFGMALSAQAQQNGILEDKVLFTVEQDVVTAGEYIAVYNKNRNLGEDIDPKTPSEYLELYKNFKLKVYDAKDKGLDSSVSFLREYNSYKNQLAKPYLSDRDVTEDLIKEAYNRLQYDVRAAHIMIGVGEQASDEDALKAFNEAKDLKEKIDNGEKFETLAKRYSDDTYSAKNGGDLGFFTAFNMVYPFESAVYRLNKGEVSDPIRTQFGYHIIKKLDIRKARGTIEVAHIMVIANAQMDSAQQYNAEAKINEIYAKLVKGDDFEALAKNFSDDGNTKEVGGLLPAFGINKMYPEFEDAAFALQNVGDFSKPVKTNVGWHIIKLVNKPGVRSLEDMRNELKLKVEKDSRSHQSYESIVKRLKIEYGFKENSAVKNRVFEREGKNFVNSLFDINKVEKTKDVLFQFANESYTNQDFYNYLESVKNTMRMSKNPRREMQLAYETFSEDKLMAYEKTQLPAKYPEYKMLAREYYEGILLFDLTEKMVWKRSVKDSAGLDAYYQSHKENYMWDTRYDIVGVEASNKKMAKTAQKMLKKGMTPLEVEKSLNKDSQLNISFVVGVFEAKDKAEWLSNNSKVGFSKITEDEGRYGFVQIKNIIASTQKTFEETRGAVISDYQNYLEQEWLTDLKRKYTIKVNEDVMNEVIEVLEKQ